MPGTPATSLITWDIKAAPLFEMSVVGKEARLVTMLVYNSSDCFGVLIRCRVYQ